MTHARINTRHVWMAKMEEALLKLSPTHAGRIDWDTATFAFNAGRTPDDAAKLLAIFAPVTRRF